METFELRYFAAAAARENVRGAAEALHISPAAVSKAITRLEAELQVVLFRKEGRTVRLTEHGRVLQRRASELLALEEATRVELSGERAAFLGIFTGPEVLLAHHGTAFAQRVRKRFPHARFELRASLNDEDALKALRRGDAHVAFTSAAVPPGFRTLRVGVARFQVCAGRTHPLFAARRTPIAHVQQHTFAAPGHALLGETGASFDGWRDDIFPRKIDYVASSLSVLTDLVRSGQALAYLPDYWGAHHGLKALQITGCPYRCEQPLHLVAHAPERIGWLNHFF